MKRTVTAVGLIAAFALTIAMLGCGKAKQAADSARQAAESAQKAAEGAKAAKELQEKGETTIETEEGRLTIKQEEGETTEWSMENKEGEKTTVSGGDAADLSDLDIAIYPGANREQAMTQSTSTGTHIAAEFTTSDSFDEVATFYTEKYPDFEKTTMTQGSRQMLVLKSDTDTMKKTVAVVKESSEDPVTITMEQKKTGSQ